MAFQHSSREGISSVMLIICFRRKVRPLKIQMKCTGIMSEIGLFYIYEW
jgi:hypothetical protein